MKTGAPEFPRVAGSFGASTLTAIFLPPASCESAQLSLASSGKPACRVGDGGNRFLNQHRMNGGSTRKNDPVCDAPPCGDA